jgi:putative ferrous iron transport protein C
MILSDLRTYLKARKSVTLRDLMLHFDTDAEALRGMLQILIAKNYVQKVVLKEACGTSCCKCDSTLIEIYEFLAGE